LVEVWRDLLSKFRSRDFILIWGIGVIALVVFFFILTLRLSDALENMRAKDQKLSSEIRRLEAQIIKAKEVKEKLEILLNLVERYRAFLPKAEDANNVAILLGSSARNSGFELERLVFRRENRVMIFNLRLKGSFSSLIDFLDKIWGSTFLIGVRDIKVTASNEAPILNVELELRSLER